MKPNEAILVKHKDFIFAVSRDLIAPNPSNDKVNEVLTSYREIDETAEILAECSTCTNIYKDSFKLIYAYCENVNWFNEPKKVIKKNGNK